MNNVTSLAIDVAKNIFQIHGTDVRGKAVLKKKISREKLLEFIANLPKCNIYMEACGTSNYWGRKIEELSHKVQLIHPKYVKPYVKRNKNDKNDAEGIAAASRDPDMRFITVKTEAQQDMQSVHRIRSLLIHQRTAIANQLRGILAEYGKAIPQGIYQVSKHVAEALKDNTQNMGELIRNCLEKQYEYFKKLDEEIDFYDKKIKTISENNIVCKKLKKIDGIGQLTATILEAVLGNGAAFKNGRHFSAFLGLVPRQHSSGGKEHLLGISKYGDTYIRTLLVHGARTVLYHTKGKVDKQSMWLKNLAMHKGNNVAAVALANKMARIAWAVVHGDIEYDRNYKPEFKSGKTIAGSLVAEL